ncbi:MAG: hypothetical protein E7311_00960 [Clostridiales bacterium]|nr:hypothetical protein [Clostridiales bacterium]
MKVLFAINNESVSNAIKEKFLELYGEELEIKNVYFFKALIAEVKKNNSYDRVLVFEELERLDNKFNKETIDQYLFDQIDAISDEVSNNEIIFVCSGNRNQNDKLLKRLFSLGIYNMLIGKDRTIDSICKLLETPRTKKEAKKYIEYGVDDIYARENTVDEVELQKIVAYFKKLGDNTDKYLDSFNRVSEQYNNMQMKIICNFLPVNVKKYLSKHSDKYKTYIKFENITAPKQEEEIEVEKPTGKKILASGKIDNNKVKRQIIEIEKTIEKPEEEKSSRKKEKVIEIERIIEPAEEKQNKEKEPKVVEKIVEVEKPVEIEKIVEVEKIVEIEKPTEVIKQVFEVPTDYSKLAVFIGGSKVGTSFLINAIAYMLSKNGVKTAILDMTRERNMFYTYTNNSEKLRKKAEKSINSVILNNSIEDGIEINKNLTLFTSLPGSDRRSYNHMKLVDNLKQNYKVILVDCDFTTPLDYYKLANEIYVVQDMDILTVQQITSFLRELKSKEISLAKMRIIINKFVKSSVTAKKLIEGMAYYYDPQMTFMDDLFDTNIDYYTVPFAVENYQKYIDNLHKCDMDFSNFTKEFLEMISVICSIVYPTTNSKMLAGKKKRFGLFR